jgi:hypothetical protein
VRVLECGSKGSERGDDFIVSVLSEYLLVALDKGYDNSLRERGGGRFDWYKYIKFCFNIRDIVDFNHS